MYGVGAINPVLGGVLAAVVVAPVLVATLALTPVRYRPRLLGRLGAVSAGVGFAGAAVLAAGAATSHYGSFAVSVFGIGTDRLAVVLLLLVFGVSAIVQTFALRYLSGDSRMTWFTAGAGLLTSASAGLMAATTTVALAACWTLAGAALCLLLGMYRELPAARDGVRRAAKAFLVGDLALWAAVGIVKLQWGVHEIRDLDARQVTGPVAVLVGLLIVTAALSRAAQLPFHRWLPATLAAPTPVSALLHAGVVNAGAVLLIRFSPLVTADLARGVTIVAGAATMVYGAVIMLVKPDIKGGLAHSTMAQMGFMTLTCGLGLWAAAVFHLVAHGFYKATLFLSSGSAISYRRRQAFAPPAQQLARRRLALNAIPAVLLPLLALAVAVIVAPLGSAGDPATHALLLFAWVSAAAALWGWLKRRPTPSGVALAAAVLMPIAVVYVTLIDTISRFLAPALPATGVNAATTWLIAAAALVVLGCLAALRRATIPRRLQHVLYTRALSAGHIATPVIGSTTPTTAHLTGAHP